MPFHVKCGEIDRDNNPVGAPKIVATLPEQAAAQAFIEGEIARYDHNGFVPETTRPAGGAATTASASKVPLLDRERGGGRRAGPGARPAISWAAVSLSFIALSSRFAAQRQDRDP